MRYAKYVIATMVLGSSLAAFGHPDATSLGTKMVYIDAQYRVDPVTITKVSVGDQTIQPGLSTGAREDKPGAPFQADEDWLKNISIILKNRTDKTIVRGEIMVYFLGSAQSQAVATYTITLGERPDSGKFSSSGQRLPPEEPKQPLVFAPGEALVVRLSDYAEEMQEAVEATVPFSQVTRITFLRQRFYFSDEMRWDDLVGFGVPDPNRPGHYTNMDRFTYFPGDPHQNWPPNEYWTPPGRERKAQ